VDMSPIARDGMKPQRAAFHYASFCSILLWDMTRVRGSGCRNSHWLYGRDAPFEVRRVIPWSESVGRTLD
jgi:hypothetical protein